MTDPSSAPRRKLRRMRGAAVPAGPTPWRWPILVLLPLLMAAGVVVQRHQDAQPAKVEALSADGYLPTASAADASSSTWYCAAGTATGAASGLAEQTLQIANDSDTARTARVTAVPNKGESVTRSTPLPAHSRVDLAVSSLVTAPYASALVEVDGGEVAVSHLLEGPTGRAVAACSSSPSASWSIPSGTTRAGARQLLALFNPFPSAAVASVTFEADDGARSPQSFDAIVVPGQSVTVLDIGATVTLRNQLATTVSVRSGRVIVDQLQTADGTQGTTESLSVTPGSPRAAPAWWFADGPADAGASTMFYVQNPGDQTADVELAIRLDDTATYGQVEPFEVSVPAGRYAVIDVTGDGRVPAGVGYAAIAQSRDGSPIIADRVVVIGSPATATGTTVMLGSPVLAGHWIVPAASFTSASSARVIVTNPSSTDPLKVTVSTVTAGKVTPLPGMSNVEVLPGGRGGFDVPTGAKAPLVLVDVSAGSSAVVEAKIVFTTGGQAAVLAVPVAGSSRLATQVVATATEPSAGSPGPSSTDSSPFDGTSVVPRGTNPPGTAS
jgi:hypothetical protein